MSERLYRLLLKLYPKAFRSRFELDMVRAFRDMRSSATQRGLERPTRTDARGARTSSQQRGQSLAGGQRESRWSRGPNDSGYGLHAADDAQTARVCGGGLAYSGARGRCNTAIFSVLHGVLLRPLEIAASLCFATNPAVPTKQSQRGSSALVGTRVGQLSVPPHNLMEETRFPFEEPLGVEALLQPVQSVVQVVAHLV